MSAPVFKSAHARGENWGLAAKACLEALGALPDGANIAFLYANEGFSGDLGSILTFLRERTRIPHWVGGTAPGLFVDEGEFRGDFPGVGGALSVMAGTLEPSLFHVFGGDAGTWPSRCHPHLGIVHGDPRDPGLMDRISQLAEEAGFLAGGLLSAAGPPAQLADQVMAGGLSGVLLAPGIEALVGMTQGCAPLGDVHTVTESVGQVILSLDGKPALDVLKGEVGELLARDLRRIAGFIHVAFPVEGSDMPDYQVRTLMGVDPAHGWFAVGDEPQVGQAMRFVRRDANSARTDLERMLTDIRMRLDGRPIGFAHYASCTGRGKHMFGEEGAEAAILRRVLGDCPLTGFFANGEISNNRVYGFTGVLTVVPGKA